MLTKLPKITIVTPSFNQAKFLERTILSVLNQNYPNLEYIIIDGGSTDGSVEIIKKYEKKLAWWVSEKDRGQAEAINKGLKRATGDWVAWQNSDDVYFDDVFFNLIECVKKNPTAGMIIANLMLIDEKDKSLRDICYVRPTYNSVLAEGMVLCNQAAFWKRDIHDDIGYLDERFHYSFDFEWFLRLLKKYKAKHINQIWGGLRQHNLSKSNLKKEKFYLENKTIISTKELLKIQIIFFKIRRLLLLLFNGQIFYILRGLYKLLSSKFSN